MRTITTISLLSLAIAAPCVAAVNGATRNISHAAYESAAAQVQGNSYSAEPTEDSSGQE